jgi:shikimate dehydrogenase
MNHVTARTRVFALIGDPVEHSLSPTVQNAAMKELGLDGVYCALQADQEGLPGFVRGLARAGGGGNVTLPHKEKAATVVEVPSAAVRRTGACNTFWMEDGLIHGDNTDVEGFGRALRGFLDREPEGFRVLVLGAGGASRAVLASLIEGDVAEIHLLNRTRDRARAVARRIGGEKVRVLDGVGVLEEKSYDLVINATRLGLNEDDPSPLDLTILGRVGGAMDVVYRGGSTSFVQQARELGIRTADGSEMLIQQGAVAFERWWGVSPPLDVMRKALREREAG